MRKYNVIGDFMEFLLVVTFHALDRLRVFVSC